MPPARKSSRSSSSVTSKFKEPAALKRLNQSLDSAQKSLTELRKHAGKDAAASTRTLYSGLGKFVKDARRDSGKFATAIKKDFDQAGKAAKSAAKTATGSARRSSSTRASSSRSGSSSRSAASRASGSRSRSTGSSTRRSTSRSTKSS